VARSGDRPVVLDGMWFFGEKLAFGSHFLIKETAGYGTLGIVQILWVPYPASKVREARSVFSRR
jgi:hypothetical protein